MYKIQVIDGGEVSISINNQRREFEIHVYVPNDYENNCVINCQDEESAIKLFDLLTNGDYEI